MKLPYFKLKEAFTETRDSFSYGNGSEKLLSVTKLVGKSAANVGMLAAELGVEVIKQAPEIAGRAAKQKLDGASHLMTDEQRRHAEDLVRAGAEARDRRLQKEREARQKEAEERQGE